MKMLKKYLKEYKWYIVVGPFFKLLGTILELCNPIIVAKIVDVGVKNNDIDYIIKLGIIILIVNIVGFLFNLISQKCASLTSTGVSTSLRKDLFKKISEFSHTELDKFGTASLVNRIMNDVYQVENAIGLSLRLLIRIPFLLLGAFVISLIINPMMSVVFLVLIPVVCVILWIYTKKTSPYYKMMREKLDTVGKITQENLKGTRVIRAFNKQEDEEKRFNIASADYTKTSIKISKISALLSPLMLLFVNIVTIAILMLGGWQVNLGNMQQGEILALIDYVTMITLSLLIMSQLIIMIVRTNASLNRIKEVFSVIPSIQDKPDALETKKLKYDAIMEFKDVSFNYANDKETPSFIKDLSFSIYPHQTIGIIGGTGSGKTTIANLMARFYDATRGEILFKGVNVKDISLKCLREDLSIVQQRSSLFKGSIRENMQLRDKDATDEEINEALKISQAYDFVSKWKDRLDHQILAGGKNISGGQLQRLTIARAIINKPDMLILDDSNSALDFLTDSKLRKALKKLDTTLVLISQRATSVQNADLIIVLDNGNVVGMGKHQELLKNCEVYLEIYRSQTR